MTGRERLARAPVAVAALSAFALAALLLPGSPGMGDSAELTLALALAGIPHPTGYPIYVLAGHLFVRIAHALGAPYVVAANLWSAAGAAVAVGAFTRLAQHVVAALEDDDVRAGRGAAARATRNAALVFPVAALALNPVWIASATTAEVYSWSNAWLAVAAAFVVGRLRVLEAEEREAELEPAGERPARERRDLRAAATWGLLSGLCGTHHATSLLFVVPLSAVLVAAQVRARRWRASLLLAALGASLGPLAAYAWIPWRAAHPAPFQWPVGSSAAALWLHVSGAGYAHLTGRFAPSAEEWRLIRAALLPWIVPGLLLGPLLALRARSRAVRWGLLALLGGAALQIAFVVRYGVPDPDFYFLPALMPSLLVAILALAWLGRRAPLAAAVPALVVALALAAWSVPRAVAERRRLADVDAGFRSAWRSIPFDRGIVLWRDDHFHRFKVLQLLEGRRQGLYVDSPDLLIWPARRRAFEARFGFDPVAGLALRTPDDVARVAENVRRRASVPVLVLRDQP